MIRRGLILKMFDAAYMPRWNDKPRLTEFTELDKQAHKMVFAYLLGQYESEDFPWGELIEGGIFEFLQRIVLTDLKPTVFYQIIRQPRQRAKLDDYVYENLKPYLASVGEDFEARFRAYFRRGREHPAARVLDAAHVLASQWEYELIRRICPPWHSIDDPERHFRERLHQCRDLVGVRKLRTRRHRAFVDLCGQLRFQIRWAPLHRVPRTSVLGHSLFVAMLSYFFSLQIGACPRRCYNNYFTGLFHDLPESLTRDIISPVKRSVEGLSEIIKAYERKQMETHVYPLVPPRMACELRRFTENEFRDQVTLRGKSVEMACEEINRRYNADRFDPRDGQLVRAADELSAFIECSVAIENGCLSGELQKAKWFLRKAYEKREIGGIRFGEIYTDFD